MARHYKNNKKSQEKIDSLRCEEMVQDRVLGLTIKELAAKYKIDRQTVSERLEPHLERIAERREHLMNERESIIETILLDDAENMAKLICISTNVMTMAMKKLETALKKDKLGDDFKLLAHAIQTSGKAFEVVRNSGYKQAKVSEE